MSVGPYDQVNVLRFQTPLSERREEKVPVRRTPGVHQDNLWSRYQGDGPVGSTCPVGLGETIPDFEDGHGVRLTAEVRLRQRDCSPTGVSGELGAVCVHHVSGFTGGADLAVGAHRHLLYRRETCRGVTVLVPLGTHRPDLLARTGG